MVHLTMGHVLKKGITMYVITRLLGATPAGAFVMGFGDMLFIAGSGNIREGWRRLVLGLF